MSPRRNRKAAYLAFSRTTIARRNTALAAIRTMCARRTPQKPKDLAINNQPINPVTTNLGNICSTTGVRAAEQHRPSVHQ
jgi:hypothetical protein